MSDYPLPNNSSDLTGRVALVTGASSGLGARFARVLAASGAKVALCARRKDRLEALAAQINAAGGHAIAIPMDATDASGSENGDVFSASDAQRCRHRRSTV